MKVLAINTSPERDLGVVSLLLESFLGGLREAGAKTELYYTCDLATGRPRDTGDLQRLWQQAGQADVLVLASPLYFDGRTGPEGATPELRQLLERLTPGPHTSADRPDTYAVHAIREEGVNPGRIVVASGSGFWEIGGPWPALTGAWASGDNMLPLPADDIADAPGVLLRGAMPRSLTDWDMIAAAREAGYELASEASVPPTAHDRARREAATRRFFDRIMCGNAPPESASYTARARPKCTITTEEKEWS